MTQAPRTPMTIRFRLTLIVGLLVFLMCVFLLVGYWTGSANNQKLRSIYELTNQKTILAVKLSDAYSKDLITLVQKLSMGVYPWEVGLGRLKEIEDSVQTSQAQLQTLPFSPEERELVQDITEKSNAAAALMKDLDSILHAQDKGKLGHLVSRLYLNVDPVSYSVQNFLDYELGQVNDQIDKNRKEFLNHSLTLGLFAFFLMVLALWFVGRMIQNQITGPLQRVNEGLKEIARGEGDLTRRLPVSSRDEIGQLAEGFNTFVGKLQEMIQSLERTVNRLSLASGQLSEVAASVSSASQQSSSQATIMAAASRQVSQNLQIVSKATNGMSQSIREIAVNANQAAQVADAAVEAAQASDENVSSLSQSGKEIGEVLKVITGVNKQTNLLALNATIEAARSGEAGKGFSVVAGEIKELARQTARSADDIGHKIEAIQARTLLSAQSIRNIGEVIQRVHEIANSIASAVEEQTATTNEMGRNLSEAAKSGEEISANISNMAQAVSSVSKGAVDIQTAARSLSEVTHQLKDLMGQFKV